MKAPILIIGHPRSRTSMVAGAFARCGAWMGTCTPPSPDNQGGYYEHRASSAIVRNALSLAAYDPGGLNALPPRSGLAVPSSVPQAIEAAMLHDGYDGGTWAYKQCKLLLMWQQCVAAWPDAKWVYVRRSTPGIVASCKRTSFFHAQNARFADDRERDAFWSASVARYLARLCDLALARVPMRTVDSDEVIGGHLAVLRDVVQWAGLEWQEDAVRGWVAPEWTR